MQLTGSLLESRVTVCRKFCSVLPLSLLSICLYRDCHHVARLDFCFAWHTILSQFLFKTGLLRWSNSSRIYFHKQSHERNPLIGTGFLSVPSVLQSCFGMLLAWLMLLSITLNMMPSPCHMSRYLSLSESKGFFFPFMLRFILPLIKFTTNSETQTKKWSGIMPNKLKFDRQTVLFWAVKRCQFI